MGPSTPKDNKFELDVMVELGRKAGETLRTFTTQIVTERDRGLESLNNFNTESENIEKK